VGGYATSLLQRARDTISAAIQWLHQHQCLLSKYGIWALPKPFDLETLIETINRVLSDDS
jgi:hypothetical protein